MGGGRSVIHLTMLTEKDRDTNLHSSLAFYCICSTNSDTNAFWEFLVYKDTTFIRQTFRGKYDDVAKK